MSNRKRGCGCGCGPIFTIIILMIVAIAVINSFSSEDSEDSYEYDYDYDYEYFDESDYNNGDAVQNAPVDMPEGSLFTSLEIPLYRSKYFELNDAGKQIYLGLRRAVMCDQLEVSFGNVDYDSYSEVAFDALLAVYYDFPEFFWLNGGCEWPAKDNGNFYIRIYCYDYWTYTVDRMGYVKAVEDAALALYSQADSYGTEYEKMKYVHDHIVTNVLYDDVCVEEANKTVQRATSQQSHTIYGVLVNDLAVCDGYAKTFQLITMMMGIDTEFIAGDAGRGHAWNHVNVDGKEYWMDVTWDDMDLEYEQGERYFEDYICYSYFLVDDLILYKEHTPEDWFKIPKCFSMDANYHVYNGYYLEKYNFEDLCDIMLKQQGKKYVTVRFSTDSEMEKAIKELFDNQRYYDIPHFGDNDDMIYSLNQDACTLNLLYH